MAYIAPSLSPRHRAGRCITAYQIAARVQEHRTRRARERKTAAAAAANSYSREQCQYVTAETESGSRVSVSESDLVQLSQAPCAQGQGVGCPLSKVGAHSRRRRAPHRVAGGPWAWRLRLAPFLPPPPTPLLLYVHMYV
jgi:hypothetical protein